MTEVAPQQDINPRKKLYSALVGNANPEAKNHFKQFSFEQFNKRLDDEKFVEDLYESLRSNDVVLDAKNRQPEQNYYDFIDAYVKVPTAKPAPKPKAAPVAAPVAVEEEEAYIPPPQPAIGSPEYDKRLQAQYGGMAPTLGATFGGVPAAFETKAQKKQEQISPAFKAQKLAFEDVPIAEEQRRAQRQFAKATKERQQAALRGGTGYELQQQQADEARESTEKLKDFGSYIGATFDNMIDKAKGAERIFAAKQRALLTFGDRGKKAEQEEKKVKQDIYNYISELDQDFAAKQADYNIEGNLFEALRKGQWDRVPEAFAYNLAQIGVNALGAATTGGYSTFAQVMPDIYKAGVEEIARKTKTTPEQVIANGNDKEVLSYIGGGISGYLDYLSGGILGQTMRSQGAYKFLRDKALDKIGKTKWKQAAASAVALGGTSGIEGATELGQGLIEVATPQVAAADTFKEARENIYKELQKPETQRRLAGEFVGGLAGGGGIAAGGRALGRVLEGDFTYGDVRKATQRADYDVVQTDNKITERNKIAQAMEEAVKANPEAEGQIRQQYQKRINEAAPTDEEVLSAYESLSVLPETEEKNAIRENLEGYMAEKGIQAEPTGMDAGLGELMRREPPIVQTVNPDFPPPVTEEEVTEELTPEEEDEDLAAFGRELEAIEQAAPVAPAEEEVVAEEIPAEPVAPEAAPEEVVSAAPVEEAAPEVAPEVKGETKNIKDRSDADIEKRMAEIEEKHNGIPSQLKNKADLQEYNTLEKEMEKRERSTVFDIPLAKVKDAVNALLKKEKEKPNGYGSFIESRDARETKEVADRYLNAKDLTDKELKKDFKDALFGKPTTWYADGLKLRESINEATRRGIQIDDLLKTVEKEFTSEGFDEATARKVIAKMLEPVFKETQEISEKQLPEAPAAPAPKGRKKKEAPVTPAPVAPEVETNKVLEKLSKRQVPEGKGSWRVRFNKETDPFKKKDILRAIADSSNDINELNDIKEAAKGMPDEGNILAVVDRKLSLKEEGKKPAETKFKPIPNATYYISKGADEVFYTLREIVDDDFHVHVMNLSKDLEESKRKAKELIGEDVEFDETSLGRDYNKIRADKTGKGRQLAKRLEGEGVAATLSFGKYYGKTIDEIFEIDPSYILYLNREYFDNTVFQKGVRDNPKIKEFIEQSLADKEQQRKNLESLTEIGGVKFDDKGVAKAVPIKGKIKYINNRMGPQGMYNVYILDTEYGIPVEVSGDIGKYADGKLEQGAELSFTANVQKVGDKFKVIGRKSEYTKPTETKEGKKAEAKEEKGKVATKVEEYEGVFNPGKTGVAGIDELLEDDGYQFFYKGKKVERVLMSPDEYLERVRKGLKTKTDANILEGKTEAIKKAIESGAKINAPFISTVGGKFSQEGRNRAVVARELGEQKIPVFIESDVTFDDKINRGADLVRQSQEKGNTTKESVLEDIKKSGLHRDGVRFIEENYDAIQGEAEPAPIAEKEEGKKAEVKEERKETSFKGIASFETAKGSVYTVLPDGRTQRFKTATKEQNEPQDLTVFVKFKDAAQEQDFLEGVQRSETSGTKVYVIDKQGNKYDTNAQAAGKDVRLALVKDGKVIDTAETSTTPKIGYNTFDQRRFEKDGEKYRQAHLGNKVVKINEQTKAEAKEEKVTPTSKPQEAAVEIAKAFTDRFGIKVNLIDSKGLQDLLSKSENAKEFFFKVLDKIDVFETDNIQEAKNFITTVFQTVESAEDAKRAYRKLAVKYHPDKRGSEEVMKHLNDVNEKYQKGTLGRGAAQQERPSQATKEQRYREWAERMSRQYEADARAYAESSQMGDEQRAREAAKAQAEKEAREARAKTAQTTQKETKAEQPKPKPAQPTSKIKKGIIESLVEFFTKPFGAEKTTKGEVLTFETRSKYKQDAWNKRNSLKEENRKNELNRINENLKNYTSDRITTKQYRENEAAIRSEYANKNKAVDDWYNNTVSAIDKAYEKKIPFAYKQYVGDKVAGLYDPISLQAYVVLDNLDETTFVHEAFSHPFIEAVKERNNELYNNLLAESKNTQEIVDYVDENYGNAPQQVKDAEYIARAIDLDAKGKLKNKTLIEYVRQFWAEANKIFKDIFGGKGAAIENISPTTKVSDIVDFVLTSGERLDLTKPSAPSFTSEQSSEAATAFDKAKTSKGFDKKYGKGAYKALSDITKNFEDIMDKVSEKIKQDCIV